MNINNIAISVLLTSLGTLLGIASYFVLRLIAEIIKDINAIELVGKYVSRFWGKSFIKSKLYIYMENNDTSPLKFSKGTKYYGNKLLEEPTDLSVENLIKLILRESTTRYSL